MQGKKFYIKGVLFMDLINIDREQYFNETDMIKN